MATRVDVVIAGNVVCDAIIGTAASVNIMPYHTMEALGLKPTGPIHSLIFPGGNEEIPFGVIKDVPVDVGRVRVITTFHVLKLSSPENSYSLLLGMPWLTAARFIMKGEKGRGLLVTIHGGGETVTISQRKASDKLPMFVTTLVDIGRMINP